MHRTPSPNPPRLASRGFSLPEIALSLAVLSIAFVSLFALLPFGLTSFRASVDTANETWIMQGLNSMIQTTEWEKITGPTATIQDEVYYYDEEGKLTDTKSNESNDVAVQRARVYQAKVIVLPLYRPENGVVNEEYIAVEGGGQANGTVAVRIIAVMANVTNQKAKLAFDKVQVPEDVENIKSDSGLSVRAFVATKMNSIL